MSNHVDVNPFSWGGFESLVYLGYFRYDDYLLAFKSFNGLSAPLPFDGNGKFLFFVGLPFNNAFFSLLARFCGSDIVMENRCLAVLGISQPLRDGAGSLGLEYPELFFLFS
jgi:hypothetical protein